MLKLKTACNFGDSCVQIMKERDFYIYKKY